MIYVKENNLIKKYDVQVNKDELERLKYDIIINCSYLKHFDGKVLENNMPNYNDYLKYINFNKELIKQVEDRSFFGSGWNNLFHVTYDERIFPEVITLINEVLNDNYNNVIKLLDYKEMKSKDNKKQTMNIDISNIEDLKKSKEEIDKIINELYNDKLNENRVSVNKYINKIRKCITLILVDELSVEDFNKTYNFVDDSIKEVLDSKLCIKM